jgi:membrane-bound PQQ-dependent dehydrogenase (glucose/quinate/shikimate family)
MSLPRGGELLCAAIAWLAVGLAAGTARTASASDAAGADWRYYGGDAGGSHFTSLDQITPANVHNLQQVWSYQLDWPATKNVAFEVTPLKVGDLVYVCLPQNDVVALDAETGAVRWKYAAHLRSWSPSTVCRGLSYYEAPGAPAECPQRLLMASVDATLRAIDAKTGAACHSFGVDGSVDLLNGLGAVKKGLYTPTSPPAIVRGMAVVGSGVPDNGELTNPSGVVRAYDAVTGRFVWAWDLGRPGQHGEPSAGESYTHNTPNVWSLFSVDEELGLVYAPTGNSNPDYYGAQRTPEAEKYSTSIVALDAATGDVRWSFQAVHHDLWDYDVGAQPVLVDVPTEQGRVPALIQPTKTGQVFVLDRRDGKPLAEVTERPVPQGAGRGDWTAKTQPFSTGMPAFTGPDLTEEDMWGLTPLDSLWCRIKFRGARYDGPMTPPSDRGWIYSTGFLGGIDWGSVAVDEANDVMLVNSFVMASRNFFVPAGESGQDPKAKLPFPYFHQEGSPYFAVFTALFRSPIGMPCQRPPYGMLSAVDLKTHKLLWSHPLGTSRNSGPLGMQLPVSLPMGSPSIGGALVTKSGVGFIAATLDQYFRAIDVRTGQELWKTQLPSAAFANPMSYTAPRSGRQFVVIGVGGNSLMAKPHGLYITAFALPEGTAAAGTGARERGTLSAGGALLVARASLISRLLSAVLPDARAATAAPEPSTRGDASAPASQPSRAERSAQAPQAPSMRGDGPPPAEKPFSITKADPAFDNIIAPDAKPELLSDRFGITEGPVWVPDAAGGYLLVSDLVANAIYKITPDNRVSVFVDKAGYSGADIDNAGIQGRSGRLHVLLIGPSCTAIDHEGRLLWCADNDGAIMRLEKDGKRTVVAGTADGKRFNGPNDLVLTHDGGMFFTDPDFGLRYGAKSSLKQLESAGVWYFKNGSARQVLDAKELGGPPDGIAISPDEKFLYLTAGPGHLKRYAIGREGALSGGSSFAEGVGIGDGIKVDLQGNVYSVSGAGPGVVRVTTPGGKLLGTINLPVSSEEPKRQICASNLAFGGREGRTLFITACQAVFKLPLRASGPVSANGLSAAAPPRPAPSPTP